MSRFERLVCSGLCSARQRQRAGRFEKANTAWTAEAAKAQRESLKAGGNQGGAGASAEDLVARVAQKMFDDAWLLCFDEFQVSWEITHLTLGSPRMRRPDVRAGMGLNTPSSKSRCEQKIVTMLLLGIFYRSVFSLSQIDIIEVTHISDAIILKRLFSFMFDKGAVVIATSNRPPEDLSRVLFSFSLISCARRARTLTH